MSTFATVELAPHPWRVLLVEDDAATAELMLRTLKRNGYGVEVASGVQAGLEALRSNGHSSFDVLLLDYKLPDGEPWELADAAHACVPEVPVVLVTGMSNEAVAIEAVRRGFADFVKKTAGFWDELPAVLERVSRLTRIKGRLDETSALMSAIVEQSSDLVAVCTGGGKLVYLSPVSLSMLGRPSTSLVGQPWTEIVAPEDRHVLHDMHTGLDEKPSQLAALRCRRKDGTLAWMEARVALLRSGPAAERMIVLTLHDVTAHREHEREMQAALNEKEVLLREVYHRVKNNLQVIQSLLKMRGRSLPEGETRAAIDTTVQRVHAMALVHERLYQVRDLANLSVTAYLRDLFTGVVDSNAMTTDQIELRLDTEEIPLSLDVAIPFGLLANELLSNCVKHGFANGRKGRIDISIHRVPGAVRLVVQDNGAGLPEGFDAARTKSMGLKLALSLAHQLGGRLEFASDHGCRVQADLTRI
jgi:PAS domain S-box-containing protein